MKAGLLLLFIVFACLSAVRGQNVAWMGGDNGQTNPPGKSISAICPDNAGGIFIAGTFGNSFSLNNSIQLNTRGLSDIFLMSLNSDSTVKWTKQIGGAGSEGYKGALSTDLAGNVYIAGSFGDSLWVDGQYLLHTGSPAAGFRSDIFVAKFTSAGTLVWLKQTKGFDIEYATDVAADSAGNVYLSGQFEYDTDLGDSILVPNTGEEDAFICKYDNSGNLMWKKICQSSGWSHEEISQIEVSPDGYTYLTGFYHDSTTTFDNILLPPPYLGGQSFVAAIAPSGTVSWIAPLQSPNGGAQVKGLRLRDSSLYVAGDFVGYLDIAPTYVIASGGQDVFLAALHTQDGSALWARKYGHTGATNMVSNGLAAAPNGQLYITGDYNDSTRFDSLLVTATGGKDIYVAICDSLGGVQFLHKAAASGDQLAGAIAGDKSGNIYMSGISLSGGISFGNRSVFTPNVGTFLAKFTPMVIPLNVSAVLPTVVQYFPNPVEKELTWSLPKGVKLEGYALYDMRGAAILQSRNVSSGKVDLSFLAPGNYVMRFYTRNGSTNVVLQKR